MVSILLFFLIAVRVGSTNTCTQSDTCESCYASSFLCHWCKDIPPESGGSSKGSCHYKLSPHGCQVGDACSLDDCSERQTCSSCSMGGCKWCASAQKCVSPYSWTCALPSNCLPNSECQRTEPEFVGYVRAVPDWALYVFAIVYCCIVTLSIFGLYHLRRILVSAAVQYQPLQEDPAGGSSTRSRIWLFRGIATVWILVAALVGVVFVLAALFWPSPPQLSMCNAQLMWSDTLNMIVNSVTTGKATVESELLVTIYNPNRLGLKINSVNGNIYYRGATVGSLDLATIDAQAGSASDGIGVMSFDGFDHITEMFYDFNVAHKLLLEFELFVNFDVGNMSGFNLAAPRFQMNVNNPPPQEHCKCKDLTAPGLSQIDYEYI